MNITDAIKGLLNNARYAPRYSTSTSIDCSKKVDDILILVCKMQQEYIVHLEERIKIIEDKLKA